MTFFDPDDEERPAPTKPFPKWRHSDEDAQRAEWLVIVKQPSGDWEVVLQTSFEEFVCEAEEIAEDEGYEFRTMCLLSGSQG
jgi:hypothetical protein